MAPFQKISAIFVDVVCDLVLETLVASSFAKPVQKCAESNNCAVHI